jgi:hypothetical protein
MRRRFEVGDGSREDLWDAMDFAERRQREKAQAAGKRLKERLRLQRERERAETVGLVNSLYSPGKEDDKIVSLCGRRAALGVRAVSPQKG